MVTFPELMIMVSMNDDYDDRELVSLFFDTDRSISSSAVASIPNEHYNAIHRSTRTKMPSGTFVWHASIARDMLLAESIRKRFLVNT